MRSHCRRITIEPSRKRRRGRTIHPKHSAARHMAAPIRKPYCLAGNPSRTNQRLPDTNPPRSPTHHSIYSPPISSKLPLASLRMKQDHHMMNRYLQVGQEERGERMNSASTISSYSDSCRYSCMEKGRERKEREKRRTKRKTSQRTRKQASARREAESKGPSSAHKSHSRTTRKPSHMHEKTHSTLSNHRSR